MKKRTLDLMFVLSIILLASLTVLLASCGPEPIVVDEDELGYEVDLGDGVDQDLENRIVEHLRVEPSCSEQGGQICSYQQYCPSGFINASDSDECCETSCLNHVKTNTCNYNTICEGYENEECKDCQCQGVVCGGLCYNYKGTCCGDKFVEAGHLVFCEDDNIPEVAVSGVGCSIPGQCFQTVMPLIVTFEIPTMYELGVEENGKIIVTNNAGNLISGKIKWSYNSKFEILTNGLRIEDTYKEINLSSGDSIEIPITIKALQVYDFFEHPYEGFSRIWLIIKGEDYPGQVTYISPSMRIYERDKPTICGEITFNMKGECINNVFYPDARCSFVDSDYFPMCANGFLFTKYATLKYDNKTNRIKIGGEVEPKGLKQVLVLRLNNNVELNVSAMQEWVETFFDKESNRMFRRNLVDFKFEDAGRVNIDWNKITTTDDLILEVETASNINMDDYDFLVGYTPRSQSKIIFNDTGGVYAGKGVLLIDTSEQEFSTIAHEMTHGFGAPDLYFAHMHAQACTSHFFNGLMCGAAIMTSGTPEEFRLYSAPWIGWADLDGDGIIDVEDDAVAKLPSWFEGIEIKEAKGVLAWVGGTNQKSFYVSVEVVDKKRKQEVPAVIGVSSPLFSAKAFSGQGMLSYTPYIMPQSKIDITVTAEYAGYKDTKTFEFDPNNP